MKFLLAKKYGALKSQLQVKEYEENHPFNFCFSFMFMFLKFKKCSSYNNLIFKVQKGSLNINIASN